MTVTVLDRSGSTATMFGDPTGLPCHREDPELFFAETPNEINVAKQLCTQCPIALQCLAGALERREPWGVWGGQLFQQGQVIAQKRPRGRPRKNPIAA